MSEDLPERWLPVVGFEGLYEVSSIGRVRSTRRPGTNGAVLRPVITRYGYRRAALWRLRKQSMKHVHVLVLEAFIGPCPDGLITRHLDGDSLNNCLSNLAWGSGRANNFDAVRHGTHYQAAKTHCPEGHPYDGVDGRGTRFCCQCRRRQKLAWWHRRKAAA